MEREYYDIYAEIEAPIYRKLKAFLNQHPDADVHAFINNAVALQLACFEEEERSVDLLVDEVVREAERDVQVEHLQRCLKQSRGHQ